MRDGDALIGLAPLLRRTRGPFRTIAEIGRGPGDYWDLLAAPGRREEVTVAVAAEIARRRREWDLVLVDGLHAPGFGEALRDSGLRVADRPSLVSVEMPLPESFDEYLAGLPRRRRSNLRRHLKRLDEGEFELALVEPARLAEAVGRWHRMRAAWWSERGLEMEPLHGTEEFRSFMVDAVDALSAVEAVEVTEMTRDGEPVGVSINLVDPRTFYVFLSAYDPSIASLGPGKIQTGEAIRSSIAVGRRSFDFTIGQDDYKYWFGAEDVSRPRQVVRSGSLRSRAAAGLGALRERRRGGDEP